MLDSTEDLQSTTIADAARKALDGAENGEVAAERLLTMAQSDTDLYERLMAPYELRACRDAIDRLRLNERQVIWNAPLKRGEVSVAKTGGLRTLASSNSYTLLHFPLPNGVRLGDARKDDLTSAISTYRKQSDDMAHKARWLTAILDKIGASKKAVRHLLKADELESLQAATA